MKYFLKWLVYVVIVTILLGYSKIYNGFEDTVILGIIFILSNQVLSDIRKESKDNDWNIY